MESRTGHANNMLFPQETQTNKTKLPIHWTWRSQEWYRCLLGENVGIFVCMHPLREQWETFYSHVQ